MKKSKALEVFKQILEAKDEFKRQYTKDPFSLLTHFGYCFPPKIKKLFSDVYYNRITRGVAQAPRGGGKTQIAAGLGFIKFFLQNFNVGIVAGSKEQALRGIEYIQDITGEPEIINYVEDETKTLIKGKTGNWIKASPASTKAIRGLHAKGRPMLLIMDEEAEMEEAIVRSALNIIRDAPISIILRLSTYHKIYGTFADLCDNYQKYGYQKYVWDSFDVCEKCRDTCSECFKNYYGLRDDIKTLEKDFAAHYCQGKAKKGQGWLKIPEIRQAFLESSREWFETENMGWRPAGEGAVLPIEMVKQAFHYDQIIPNPSAEHWFGIDWGFKGTTAVEFLEREDEKIKLLESLEFHQTSLDLIIEHLHDLGDPYHCKEIYADASHPFENSKLTDEGFDVIEVPFVSYKETGAGWLKYLFERDLFMAPKKFENVQRQLINWRRDKTGKIVKKDDHHCDALLAATKKLELKKSDTMIIGPRVLPQAGSDFVYNIIKVGTER
uniref:Terminase large subunit gp17-like C-terminal domain-containing protein n=1 Tax=candidate division WOR-3 bacterium TaxID=2052148 RepID=A0A7C6EBJ7_UNCW3